MAEGDEAGRQKLIHLTFNLGFLKIRAYVHGVRVGEEVNLVGNCPWGR